MLTFGPKDFEQKIFNDLELSGSYKPLVFLTRDIPDIFKSYVKMCREAKESKITENPALTKLIKYILSLYFNEDGQVEQSRYVYREVNHYAKEILSLFSYEELFCIVYDMPPFDEPCCVTELHKRLVKDSKLDTRFPNCLAEFFINPNELQEIVDNVEFSLDRYSTVDEWIDENNGFPLLLNKDRMKGFLTHFFELNKSGEFGLLEDLYSVANKYTVSSIDPYVYENKLFATNLMDALSEILVEKGFEYAVNLPCKDTYEDSNSKTDEEKNAIHNYRSISLFLTTLFQGRKSIANKLRIGNEYKNEFDDKFIEDMVLFTFKHSQGSHEDSLLDGLYEKLFVSKAIEIVTRPDYRGEKLKITRRFINAVNINLNSVEMLMDTSKFDVQWCDSDGYQEMTGWDEYLLKNSRNKLTEKNSLKRCLNTQDYYLLIMLLDKEAVDSADFREFCNNNKSKLFVDAGDRMNSDFKTLKPGAIEIIKSEFQPKAH